MVKNTVLIIEDDQEMSEIIALYLTKYGFNCRQVFSGQDALSAAREYCPDIVILDVQLPIVHGFSICRALRQEMDVPIIFLSCHSEEQDKINGLEAGGDDYMTKPFSLAELLARIKAALRRSGLPDPGGTPRRQTLEFPGLTLDLTHMRAVIDDTTLELPPMEFQLLARLARNPGWTFTSEQLFSLVWGADSIDTRTVAVHINRLRNKLSQNTAQREYILTVWGKGYKFNDQLI